MANSSPNYHYKLNVARCAERCPSHSAHRSVRNLHSRPYRHNLRFQTDYAICKLTYAVAGPFCSVCRIHVAYILLNLSNKPDNTNCLFLCRSCLYICAPGGGKGSCFLAGDFKRNFHILYVQNNLPSRAYLILHEALFNVYIFLLPCTFKYIHILSSN